MCRVPRSSGLIQEVHSWSGRRGGGTYCSLEAQMGAQGGGHGGRPRHARGAVGVRVAPPADATQAKEAAAGAIPGTALRLQLSHGETPGAAPTPRHGPGIRSRRTAGRAAHRARAIPTLRGVDGKAITLRASPEASATAAAYHDAAAVPRVASACERAGAGQSGAPAARAQQRLAAPMQRTRSCARCSPAPPRPNRWAVAEAWTARR